MTHAEATRRFYAHLWPLRAMLLRTASFLTPSQAEAEDLVQETLLKAFRAIDRFDVTTHPQPWLTAILRNVRIDRFRAAGRGLDTVSLEQSNIDLPAPAEPPAQADLASAAAILEQFSDQALIAALKRLPEDILWTILLVDVEGLDYEAAAGILEIPPGTVKSRLHRGRRMLKDMLLDAPPPT